LPGDYLNLVQHKRRSKQDQVNFDLQSAQILENVLDDDESDSGDLVCTEPLPLVTSPFHLPHKNTKNPFKNKIFTCPSEAKYQHKQLFPLQAPGPWVFASHFPTGMSDTMLI
jgi:hypothetical protein